jgi:molecular chaperone DnaK
MSNRFVSLAIDHGTTNSCIACMTPQGPRVIPADPSGPTLPSAVYYDVKGGLQVGSAARRAILTTPAKEGQGFTGYKLQIGGDARFEFTAAHKSMSAPELGAVVIQTLLRAHFKASGEDPKACVITIPAKFKQNSVEGTRAAAEMAGLKYYPLIMEPVAAAMCYGFNAKEKHAEWMVFDLGGGTLDVSLVIARKGKLVVPDGGHAGDDNLGGAKFDNELAGYVVQELEKVYKLSNFRTQRRKFSNEWGRLLLAVEDAKIRLSTQTEVIVELPEPLCLDENKKEVMVKVPVTRKVYEDLIRPDAERAVEMCQMLLRTNRLEAREVERLILIGGPSKSPLIRNLLAERLGIPLDSSVDPMTAVAEGAAIYADQVEIPAAFQETKHKPSGGFSLRLECDRQSSEPVYAAVGMVDGPSLSSVRVEIERLDGGWKSGQIPMDASGVFSVELVLIEREKPTLSEFRTTLLDPQGKELARINEPAIWYPSLGVENRLANSLRVAVKGGRTELLIQPGAELPAEGEGDFATAKALRRGSKDDVLQIPVLESITNPMGKEDDRAAGCVHVGTLRIVGSDERVTSDVPEGSEVQVRLIVDNSRAIKAVAYIPLLDQEFVTIFQSEKFEYELKDLPPRFELLKSNLKAIEKLHSDHPMQEVGDVLASLDRQKLLESVATDLERAQAGDLDSETRAYKRILEIEGTIRSLDRMQHRARIEVAMRTLGGLVQGDEVRMLGDIGKEFCGATSDGEVERILESVEDLEFAVRGRPWRDLSLDVMALSGLKVTTAQHAAFNKANTLWTRVSEKGGSEKATDADIAEMKAMHLELREAYPDLYDHVQRFIDEWNKSHGGKEPLSDIVSRRK